MTLDDALAVAASRSLNFADVEALVASGQGASPDVLTNLAMEVATRYLKYEVTYLAADELLNSMFGYACARNALTEKLHEVFLAFDSGEFVHAGEPPDTEPQEKYTRPLLEKALSTATPPNNPLDRSRPR